jgi:uncharacterized protein (DUF433 family)
MVEYAFSLTPPETESKFVYAIISWVSTTLSEYLSHSVPSRKDEMSFPFRDTHSSVVLSGSNVIWERQAERAVVTLGPTESQMGAQNLPSDEILLLDGAMIIDRGRGPEIAGTRITIFDIMDFLKYGCDIDEIAKHLWIKREQVIAAVDYIKSHQDQADREYALIVERMNRPNPPEVEQGRAKTREELQRRLTAHLEKKGANEHNTR